MSYVNFFKWQCCIISVAYFPPCNMLNLRNIHVSCHLPKCCISLSLMSHVEFKKKPMLLCQIYGSRAIDVTDMGLEVVW